MPDLALESVLAGEVQAVLRSRRDGPDRTDEDLPARCTLESATTQRRTKSPDDRVSYFIMSAFPFAYTSGSRVRVWGLELRD